MLNCLIKPGFKMRVGGSPFDRVIVGTGIGIPFKLLLDSFSGFKLLAIIVRRRLALNFSLLDGIEHSTA